jgi:hypothetical protein
MFPTTIAGSDMVEGQFPGLFTTILAGVIIAAENLNASQFSLKMRPLNFTEEMDH